MIGAMTHFSLRFAPLFLALLGATAHAQSRDHVVDGNEGYLIGASMSSSSSHVGNAKVQFNLKPMWAFQLGSVRISRSRAGSLMGAGKEKLETGLSTQFNLFTDWDVGASLRIDNGRSFDEDPALAGLPDVRDTVRARFSTGRSFGPRWSWRVSVDQDLLGRAGGLRLNQGVGYRLPVDEQTFLDFSLGTTWGSRRYMQTQYGIDPAAAQATGRRPFVLGNGWESLRAGVQYTHAINDNWVLFGEAEMSNLLRQASRSPLVGRVSTHGLSFGIAYRGK